jgi:hypothetical protein
MTRSHSSAGNVTSAGFFSYESAQLDTRRWVSAQLLQRARSIAVTGEAG